MPGKGNSFRLRTNLRWMVLVIVGVLFGPGSSEAATNKKPTDLWWSLNPVSRPPVPEGDAAVTNPIDRFLNIELRARGLKDE